MKTPWSSLRFVCLVCALTSTLGENFQVHQAPGVRVPGIKGCLPSPVSSFTVRVHSLKTSGGSVYTRQLVTTADLPCFENTGTKATLYATTIANCAEVTAKKGLNSFSWENSTCTAYLAWRPKKRTNCTDGGSKEVYVVEKTLTPFGGGKFIVSGKINYGALPKVFIDISQRNICGFSSDVYKGYKLLINGSDVVMLPEGNATYRLSLKLLCSVSVNILLWSVGADGKVNSNEVQMTYTGGVASNYYGLTTGGCVYNSRMNSDYDGSLQYCKSIANGTLYFEEVDGGAIAFSQALMDAGFPIQSEDFYVGLRWIGDGQWKWLGGLLQPSADTMWSEDPPPGTYDCANMRYTSPGWRFNHLSYCNVSYPIVCYFPNP